MEGIAYAETGSTVTAPATPDSGFQTREKGFALETGLSLHIGANPLSSLPTNGSSGTALTGGLFGGYKHRRLIIGLGLQLGGAVGSADSTATVVVLIAGPGVRVTLFQSSDRKLEVAGQVDLGVGHTFGSSGAQQPGVLGSSVAQDDIRVLAALGPAIRYWVHPQLALVSSILLRLDYVHVNTRYPGGTELTSNRYDLNFSVGLGLLAVM